MTHQDQNVHKTQIHSLAYIDGNNTFVTADEAAFRIWGFNPTFNMMFERVLTEEEGEISRLVYGDNLIVYVAVKKGM